MTYETLTEILQRVAAATFQETGEPGTYTFSRKVDISNKFDAPFPQIFITNPRGNLDYFNDNETNRLDVGFIYEDSLSNDADKRDEVFVKADNLMRVFFRNLKDEGDIMFDAVDYVQANLIFQSSASGWVGPLVIRSKEAC